LCSALYNHDNAVPPPGASPQMLKEFRSAGSSYVHAVAYADGGENATALVASADGQVQC